MDFINTTENTVHLNDIDLYIPFLEYKCQSIDIDIVKKSKMFQSLFIQNHFKIVKIDKDPFECNLLDMQNKQISTISPYASIDVHFYGQFLSNTGYSKANRNLAISLAKLGLNVSIEPIGTEDGLNELEARQILFLKKPYSEKSIFIHSGIPSTCKRSDNYSILNTTIECDSIPDSFVNACSDFDEIWTVSDYGKQILIKSGVKVPIYVIPNSIDLRFYNEKAKPHYFFSQIKKLCVFKYIWLEL